jgi:hypothetical protein
VPAIPDHRRDCLIVDVVRSHDIRKIRTTE